MKNRLVALFTFLFTLTGSFAQELNCTVQVLAPQIQNVDKKVFESLQTSIFEFMNNTRWTSDVFKNDERIECSISINLAQQVSQGEYKGTLQVQSRRPTYKTSYNSPILNYNDNDFSFKYLEFQQLEFSENTFTSNLTSVLAFYAYMIIGMDYDSFAPEGGTQFYARAQTIVNNAQNATETGWKAFEGNKNRYWFVQNMLDQNFKPIRQALYGYHRLGLDIMNGDIEAGRGEIFTSIEQLQKVYNVVPNSYLMQIFFNAKSDEIINIFSEAFPDIRAKIVPILTLIDPGNSSKYQRIASQ